MNRKDLGLVVIGISAGMFIGIMLISANVPIPIIAVLITIGIPVSLALSN